MRSLLRRYASSSARRRTRSVLFVVLLAVSVAPLVARGLLDGTAVGPAPPLGAGGATGATNPPVAAAGAAPMTAPSAIVGPSCAQVVRALTDVVLAAVADADEALRAPPGTGPDRPVSASPDAVDRLVAERCDAPP